MRKDLKLYWWKYNENGESGANFGDELSQLIIAKLLNYQVSWADFNNAEVIGAGSILQVATKVVEEKTFVWGSGYINQASKNNNDNLIFRLVRGKNTRALIGKRYKNTPMGDPGILISLVFPKMKQTGKIGIVPHYLDKDNYVVKQIKHHDNYILIDPLAPAETVVRQISSCKLVLSSSLHGLIVADAYGVPNIHVQLSDKVTGGEYKFKDYCSGVGRSYKKMEYRDVFNGQFIEEVIDAYQPIRDLPKVQKRVLGAFPSLAQILFLRFKRSYAKRSLERHEKRSEFWLRLRETTRVRTRVKALLKKLRH